MARPVRHPKTGVYWFRKRVPGPLVALVGKREEKRSLATKDPHEARRAHARVTAEVERRWANLRREAIALDHRQVHELAGEVYRRIVAANEGRPGRRGPGASPSTRKSACRLGPASRRPNSTSGR